MKYIVSRVQGSGKTAAKVQVSTDEGVYADGYTTKTLYDAVPYTTISFYNNVKRWLRDTQVDVVATFHVTGDYVVESV